MGMFSWWKLVSPGSQFLPFRAEPFSEEVKQYDKITPSLKLYPVLFMCRKRTAKDLSAYAKKKQKKNTFSHGTPK